MHCRRVWGVQVWVVEQLQAETPPPLAAAIQEHPGRALPAAGPGLGALALGQLAGAVGASLLAALEHLHTQSSAQSSVYSPDIYGPCGLVGSIGSAECITIVMTSLAEASA